MAGVWEVGETAAGLFEAGETAADAGEEGVAAACLILMNLGVSLPQLPQELSGASMAGLLRPIEAVFNLILTVGQLLHSFITSYPSKMVTQACQDHPQLSGSTRF